VTSHRFLFALLLTALVLSACNNRSRGRVPTTDSSVTLDSGAGDASDSSTDTSVTGDTSTTDTGGGDTISPPTCTPDFEAEGDGPIASGVTSGTSRQGGSCGGDSAPEAIVTWTASFAGTYGINTVGSDYDTVLYVRRGTCDGLEAECDDDGRSPQSEVFIDAAAGESFYIFVDGYSSNMGSWVLNVEPAS